MQCGLTEAHADIANPVKHLSPHLRPPTRHSSMHVGCRHMWCCPYLCVHSTLHRVLSESAIRRPPDVATHQFWDVQCMREMGHSEAEPVAAGQFSQLNIDTRNGSAPAGQRIRRREQERVVHQTRCRLMSLRDLLDLQIWEGLTSVTSTVANLLM